MKGIQLKERSNMKVKEKEEKTWEDDMKERKTKKMRKGRSGKDRKLIKTEEMSICNEKGKESKRENIWKENTLRKGETLM